MRRSRKEPSAGDKTSLDFPFFERKYETIFFILVSSNVNCSQLVIECDSYYKYAKPLKIESNLFEALRNFGSKVGIPQRFKTENAQAEVRAKWIGWYQDFSVNENYTKVFPPR